MTFACFATAQMENGDLILTILLVGLGTLFWVALVAVGCYCVRRKRLRTEEDAESLQTILSDSKGIPDSGSAIESASGSDTSSIVKKLKKGLIGFRSPLIRTRSVG